MLLIDYQRKMTIMINFIISKKNDLLNKELYKSIDGNIS